MGARELFEQIRAEGWPLLARWQAEKSETESLILDFKQAMTHGEKPELALADRDAIASSVSAFANTDGGVLLFGVEAKSIRKGPDVVQAIRPVPNVARFTELVRSGARSLVEPLVSGLDAFPVPSPDDATKGVVVLFVPPSLGAPHRASGGTEGVKWHYFTRSVDSTSVMPHRTLAALFAARPEPRLCLVVRWIVPGQGRPDRWILELRNDGASAARNIRVFVTASNGSGAIVGVIEEHHENWNDYGVMATTGAIVLNSSLRLYPEDTIPVGAVKLDARGVPREPPHLTIGGRVDSETTRPLKVEAQVLQPNELWEFSHDGSKRIG